MPSKFQQRHYEAVTELIKSEIPRTTFQSEVTKKFADMFALDNPRFKRGLFLKACGVRDDKELLP